MDTIIEITRPQLVETFKRWYDDYEKNPQEYERSANTGDMAEGGAKTFLMFLDQVKQTQ